ncbi:hypothetical protein ACQ4PT_016455 [Festuca glaucescens]
MATCSTATYLRCHRWGARSAIIPATCSIGGGGSFRAPGQSADRWEAGAQRGIRRVNPRGKWRAVATPELVRQASGRRPTASTTGFPWDEADNEVHLVDGEVGEEEDLAAVEWDRENPQMEEGSIFASMSECRNALVTYCIKAERTFEVDKSDQVKVNPLKHRCEESTLRKETISRAKSRWVAEEVNVDPSFGESFDENVDTNEDQNVDPNEEENVDPNDDPNEAPNDPNDDPNEDQNEAPNEAPNDGGQPSVVASSASSVVVSKNKVKEPTTKRRKEEAMSTRITRSKVDARRTRITRSKVDATSTRITRSKVDARRTRITRSKKL